MIRLPAFLLVLMTLPVLSASSAAAAESPPEPAAGSGAAGKVPKLELRLLERVETAAAGYQPRRRPPFGGQPSRSRGPSEPRFGLSLHTGYRSVGVDSTLFEDNEFDFGLDSGDFLAARFGMEFDFAVRPRFTVLLGIDSGSARTSASYIDFVFDDGAEIVHDAGLEIREIDLGVRLRLFGQPGGSLSAYVAGGAAGMLYRYWEDGEFVDFGTYDIFYDRYEESQFQLGAFFGAGAEVTVFRMPRGHAALLAEFRYATSNGEHRDSFDGFGSFVVTRTGVLIGMRLWF